MKKLFQWSFINKRRFGSINDWDEEQCFLDFKYNIQISNLYIGLYSINNSLDGIQTAITSISNTKITVTADKDDGNYEEIKNKNNSYFMILCS